MSAILLDEKKRSQPKGHLRIFLLVLIVMGLLAGFLLASYQAHQDFSATMLQRTQEQLLTVATITGRGVEHFVGMDQRVLGKMGQAVLSQQAGWEVKFNFYCDMHQEELVSLLILSEQGQVMAQYPAAGPASSHLRRIDEAPGFMSVLETGQIYTGTAYYTFSGELVFSLYEPLVNGRGQVNGVAVRTVNLDQLAAALILPAVSPRQGKAWIFDEDDVVLYHRQTSYIGLSIPELIARHHQQQGTALATHDLRDHIAEGHGYINHVKVAGRGFGIFWDCDNSQELVAYQRLTVGDRAWNLVVSLPYAEVAGPIHEHAKKLASQAGLAMLLLLIVVGIVVRSQRQQAAIEMEAKYLRQVAEQATRTNELERMVMVKQRMASLGHVAAGIAHEIRNPLSGINVYLTALRRLLENEEAEDLATQGQVIITEMEEASARMAAVIKRVIDFSKPTRLTLKRIELNHTVETATQLAAVTLRKAGVQLQVVLAPKLLWCQADSHLLEQVVLNLITNSVQAMKKNTTSQVVVVKTEETLTHFFLSVNDSGPGIPLVARQQVFEPFYTTKSEGTGIGLSLSQRIIMDHGGKMQIETATLGGASIQIMLPKIAEDGSKGDRE